MYKVFQDSLTPSATTPRALWSCTFAMLKRRQMTSSRISCEARLATRHPANHGVDLPERGLSEAWILAGVSQLVIVNVEFVYGTLYILF